MADLTDAELRRAEARGRKMLETEPRAVAAHYDVAAGRVVIDLANGCAYAFPAQRVQDLHGASGDLNVPALVNGIFGNRAWMARELARLAGRTRSPKKAAAARSNGAKGGRPRKAAKG
jgi:hypothetical protein